MDTKEIDLFIRKMADTGIVHGTDAWKDRRSQAITGTDVGVILGLDRYKTPKKLLYEKRHRVLDSMADANPLLKQALKFGTLYEPAAIQSMLLWREGFEHKYDKGFVPSLHVHRRYNWLIGSPDYLFPATRTLAEIKTHWIADGRIDIYNAVPFEAPEYIKPTNYMQVQTYLEIMDYDSAVLCSWTLGNGFSVFEISRDPELFSFVLPQLQDFRSMMQLEWPEDRAMRAVRMSALTREHNRMAVYDSTVAHAILKMKAIPNYAVGITAQDSDP